MQIHYYVEGEQLVLEGSLDDILEQIDTLRLEGKKEDGVIYLDE